MLLIKFILLQYAALIILGKFKFKKWLSKRSKFFYNLTECLFCYTHFVGWLCMPLFVLAFIWTLGLWQLPQLVIFPLMGAAFLFMFEKQISE